MLTWAHWFQLSRYGYLLLSLLLFDFLGVVSSASCTVKSHVSKSSSRAEDEFGFNGCECHTEKDVPVRDVVLCDISSSNVQCNLQEGCHLSNFNGNLEQVCLQSTLPTFSVKTENYAADFSCDVSHCQDGDPLRCGRSHMPEKKLGIDLDDSSKLLDGHMIFCSMGSMPDMLQTENIDSFGITTSCRLSNEDDCGHRTSSTLSGYGHGVDKITTSSVLSPEVLVRPLVLDWEINPLLSPSFSFLTIRNTHNQNVCHAYESFSTDPQFYAYGFEEKLLSFGDDITVTFVSLPKLLGCSSAKLILQTSGGGFVIHAKGDAVESPYQVHRIVYQNQLAKNCSKKLSGNIFISLWSSANDQVQRIVVPFEAEIFTRVFYADFKGSYTILMESLVRNDAGRLSMFSLSLKNGASSSLKGDEIREVSEAMEHFQIKYVNGLILSPQTPTQMANLIYHAHSSVSENVAAEVPNSRSDCYVFILMNDSVMRIEIPCQVIFKSFSGIEIESTTCSVDVSNVVTDSEDSTLCHPGTQIFSSFIQLQLLMKDSDLAKSDECIIDNWRPQRPPIGMSVFDDLEILFPIVQVGKLCSKWITVKNPSQEPGIMQLVLNSGISIDQCLGSGDLSQFVTSSSIQKETSTKRDVFFISDGGVTEVYLSPNESASLGPILFRPISCCVWRSSAFVRNNLTGIESLSLQGAGGLATLILLEGSKPVQSLEFDFGLPLTINVLPPERMFNMKSTSATCMRPLLKILFANAGDLPLEVKHTDISGIGSGSDGFTVDTCGSFVLQPGESRKLLVSYQIVFSAAVVDRDVELAIPTRTVMMPMRANLPSYMLSLFRKSFFCMLVRKISLLVLVAVSAIFLVFCRVIPQATTSGHEYLCNTNKIIYSVTRIGKARPHHNLRSFRVATMHPTDLKFGVQTENHKKHEAQILSSQDAEWIDDNHVNSSLLPSYDGDYKRSHLSSVYSASMSKHVEDVSGLVESPKTSNLTVRMEKEKGKRRKKRSGVQRGKHEVSGSQSGNSTPSSPVSPLISFASCCPDSPLVEASPPTPTPDVVAVEMLEYTHRDTTVLNCTSIASKSVKFYVNKMLPESLPVPGSLAAQDPLLNMSTKASCSTAGLPSATSPSAVNPNTRMVRNPPILASSPSSPCLPQPSAIALYARAPGSRLGKERTAKEENENDGFLTGEGLTYDIWGNHFPEIQLMDQAGSCSSKLFGMLPDSHSLFAETPQTHLWKSLY